MKIAEWAPIAEVVSSVAVVVTVCVLILEVRGNTAALERQARLGYLETTFGDVYRSPYLPAIVVKIDAVDGVGATSKALIERYGLSQEEAVRWFRFASKEWGSLLADYEYFGDRNRLRRAIAGLIRFPPHQIYWEKYGKQQFQSDFVQYVESVRDGTLPAK